MAQKISFLKFGNNGFFTGNMNGIKERFKQEDVSSVYNPGGSHAGNAISYNLWEAILLYNGKGGRQAFVGKTSDGYVSELMSKDGVNRQLVHLKGDNGKFAVYAGISDSDPDKVSIKKGYIVGTNAVSGYSGTAVILALLPYVLEDAEARDAYGELKSYIDWPMDDDRWVQGDSNLEYFARQLALLTDNIYRRVQEGIISLPSEQKDIKMFSASTLTTNVSTIAGTPYYFKEVKMEDVLKELRLADPKSFSANERKLIPVMPASFRWSEWIIKTAQYIKRSSKYAEPIRTCYFIGPAGCGKSLGTVGASSALGLPYDHTTCQSSMELFDFLGQIFPNTDPSQKMNFDEVRKMMGLPSVEDIIMDKEAAYVQMYRKAVSNPDSILEQDLICDMVNKVNAKVSEMCDSKDYTYIEGGLVKALRNGYAFEIQEIGIVKRAGVAVGLNALLESGKNAFITLPTGEVIRKHPNCVIFFTSNDEYEGTNNLNQSVLSRMGHVVWFKNSSVAEMAKRAKGIVTDFYSDKVLMEMAQIIEDITNFCKDKGITDGVCGQRELNNWAMEVMMELEMNGLSEATNEILRMTCQTTVLGKASQNADDIMDIAEGVVDAKYGSMALRI